MTRVLVVSGDDTLRAAIRGCAAAAGLHVAEHEGLASARLDWQHAEVVFLGAELGEAAARAGMPAVRELIVVADSVGSAPFPDAAALGAAYVALLPAARAWLADRMRRAGAPALGRRRDGRCGPRP